MPQLEWVLGDDRGKGRDELYSRPLQWLVDGRYRVVGYLNDRDAASALMDALNDGPARATVKVSISD